MHEEKLETELFDPELADVSIDEAKRVIEVALLCTQTSPNVRPSMTRVVAMLTGDIQVTTKISRPAYLVDWKFNDASDNSPPLTVTERLEIESQRILLT